MAARPLRFLVLGATGGTGKHFIAQALREGHAVRALVRNPGKLLATTDATGKLEVVKGSITETVDTDKLVEGVDFVVSMLGDRAAQANGKIVFPFVQKLVPSMRRHGVKRFLYQAGGLSKPYGGSLTTFLWLLRNTVARGFNGQHEDNEAVMEYLATDANDLEWIVHRAGIGADGPSKGVLERSATSFSVASHLDCATYSYGLVRNDEAVRSCEFSMYKK
ncbi:MAG: hypothetical protein TREMPRED_004036 [Tremellales sp. Tagirdzhanova-0007]|nr:MAG: hypothetical protein TREMPRED_004036 [Tremellales sp. Tagirdzhanova-0007]